MNKLLLLCACSFLAAACGSNSGVAKTNVNAVNSVPYSRTENAYSLAQRDIDLAPLEDFVGKTESEMNLWQNKGVVRQLKQLMGADFETMVKFWNTETPLKKFGDSMMLTGCERDNCANNRYVIFLSLSEGLIGVVHIGEDTIR